MLGGDASGPVLAVRGLEVAYGEHTVVAAVDLEVHAGELVGLIGPNGCGKTTLLRAVGRVLPWRAGDVLFEGVSVATLSAREVARRIAVVPQNAQLPPGFSARDVVLMGRTPYLGFLAQEGAADLAAAEAALALVGAQELAARPVDELSGGERQNVLIARALAQSTPLLLLDEPTANLDIGHQIAIATLLKRLVRERGLAVLAAVHDLTLAGLYCDRLALMTAGRVLLDGAPAQVITRENLGRAYGAGPGLARLEGLPSPVVLPWTAAGRDDHPI